jgi:peroxiredoxin
MHHLAIPILFALAAANPLLGKPAPDFTLPSDRGENVTLSSFAGHRCVVLAFFPKSFTPG